MPADDRDAYEGLSRRDLIKRSAIVGGTVLWASPVIQSLTSAAGAASAVCSCDACVEFTVTPPFGRTQTFFATCSLTAGSCACACCCAGVSDSCSNCAGGAGGACSVPPVFVSCSAFIPGTCP